MIRLDGASSPRALSICACLAVALPGCALKEMAKQKLCVAAEQAASLPTSEDRSPSRVSAATAESGEADSEEPTDSNLQNPFEPAVSQRLRHRRVELDRREAVLAQREAVLAQKIAALAEQSRPSSMPSKATDERQLFIPTVVDGMDAKAAARMIEAMEDADAAAVLASLATQKAGNILASVEAKKAATISTLLLRRRERGAHAH